MFSDRSISNRHEGERSIVSAIQRASLNDLTWLRESVMYSYPQNLFQPVFIFQLSLLKTATTTTNPRTTKTRTRKEAEVTPRKIKQEQNLVAVEQKMSPFSCSMNVHGKPFDEL